nr:hypothetical protein [Tanacetum cinerariifolium]
LPSDIQSKESTLQVVYDVQRGCPFFKAFLVTADVPEIYMQEFRATTYVHQYSIRFKMDSKKNIVDLEAFREMLRISPRVSGQSFDELPFEKEILDFLRGTQESKEKQRDVLPKVHKSHHPSLHDEETFNPKTKQAKAKSPSDPSELARTEAEQLKIVLRRSRHETHISQRGGSSTDEGTGSKPGVPDVPSDD